MTPADAISALPHKTFDVEFKDVDDASGSFTMYAACFGNVDRQGDCIEPGAFENLQEFVKDGWIALSHDQAALAVAMVDTATQDATGLFLTGKFHSTPDAQACRTVVKERMAAGKAVKCSIGYLVPIGGEEYEQREGKTVRIISKLSVYEASFVNLPANPLAEVQTVKSVRGFDNESEAEMSQTAVVKALKRVLGLSTKGDYKVSGEEMEKMKGLATALGTSAKSIGDCHKSLKSAVDAHAATAEEFTKCFKSFTSGQQQDEADDNEGDDAEEDKKDDEEEDEEKPEPKAKEEESEDEKTRKMYREILKRRATLGRRNEVCP